MVFDPSRPHRRFNLLLEEWVLVSPHRTQRPWLGQTENPHPKVSDNSGCFLCPGNTRANGEINPYYSGPYVFPNDFSALSPLDGKGISDDGFFRAEQESGICRVLCYSPDHGRHIGTMEKMEVVAVIGMWQEQYRELSSLPDIGWVQIFENRGEMMGASNPHPHGQVWASRNIPPIPLKMQTHQKKYYDENSKTLLGEVARRESESGERLVLENQHWIALVPFWAVWPYETLILPKMPLTNLLDLNASSKNDLASILQSLVQTYDSIFEVPFPYSMGIMQAPKYTEDHPEWTLHLSFMPPLLRSATIRKFMVGYELFASAQRDLTAESAAKILREIYQKNL